MLKFSEFVDKLNSWVGNTICYLVIVVMLTGVYEVGSRYFFNRPTNWVWEGNSFLLCVFVALGGGYTLLVRGHVKVDIVRAYLSPRANAILDATASFFMFLFLGVLAWHGIEQGLLSLERLETSQTMWRPPLYPFKVLLVIGIFLFLLQGMADFVRYIYIASTDKRGSSGT